MVKKHNESSDSKENTILAKPEIDYSPKNSSLTEQILFFLKLLAVISIFIAPMIWFELVS